MSDLRTLRSLADTLFEYGDRPVLFALRTEGAESWSYADLTNQVRRLARGLVEAGLGRGDRVALLAPNEPGWIAACLAVIEAGAVIVPLDVQLDDGMLSHALHDSDARFVFTNVEGADRLERLEAEAAPEPILLDAEAEDKRSWWRLLADEDLEMPEVGSDDPAALFYTSGTTGTSKGVPLSHGNLAFQLNTLREADVVTEDDRVLLPLPLHHVYPFVMGMLAPLSLGLTIVLPHSLTGPQIVRALNEGSVTLIVGVPRLYGALYSAIQERARSSGRITAALFKAGESSSTWLRRRLGLRFGKLLLRPLHRQFGPDLRVLASGGSTLDPDLALDLEGLGWRVAVGYGLTETSPLLTLNPPDGKKLGSVGRPIPGIEVRVDPSAVPGEEEPEEQKEEQKEERRTDEPQVEGEILARGPSVFSGYRNLPEKTEEAFTDDGWYRTEDLGYFDKDGYLFVTGRVSTLIVTEGGKNVQPEDVEEAYLESPAIAEIGVLQKDGRLVAVIVPDRNEVGQREEVGEAIRAAINERSKRLPSYRRLSDYAVTQEALAYTRLGKLRRHLLEERFDKAKWGEEETGEESGPVSPDEMAEEDRALLENPAARRTWDWLADSYPDRRLTPDTGLQLDLGIDSMEWVNLTLEMGQSVGVELDEEAIGRIDTVRDLLKEVAEQGEADGGASQVLPLEQPEEVLSDKQKRWLEPMGPVASVAARGMFALNRAIARRPFRLETEGIEHLPEKGPFVLAPNHVSYLDAFAVAAVLPYRRLRETYWAGWVGAAFGNPLTRLISRLAQAVPVDPDRAVFSSLAFGAAVLKREKNLVWFPEGQRSPTGELQEFKPGIGMLLNRYRAPVVPVSIHGTREAMPPGKILPRPEKVKVTFGRPLAVDELERQGEGGEPRDRIVQALRARVAELVGDPP
jgi:long-chain acyl-CoA synthetase